MLGDYKVEKAGNILKNSKMEIFLGLCFGFMSMLSTKVHFHEHVAERSDANYFDPTSWMDFFVFLLFFVGWVIVLKILFIGMSKLEERKINLRFSLGDRTVFLISTIVLFLAWLPYLLSFYPGSVLGDSLNSIHQVMSGVYNNINPFFYTSFIGVCMKIGSHFGDINVGIFLYTLIQFIIMLLTLSYSLMFLNKKKVNLIFIGVALLYYAIMPFFPTYAIIMWKDPLFTVAIHWLAIYVYEVVEKPELFDSPLWLVKTAVMSLLVIFLRNNGFPIVVMTGVVVSAVYIKRAKKFMVSMVGVLILSFLIQGPGYRALGVITEGTQALGVPMQQIAYVVVNEEDTLTDEERGIINEIMPIEKWREAYAPCRLDDLIKHADYHMDYFEKHKKKVMSMWLNMLPKHFDSYVKAYCMVTLGFWHPYLQNKYGYIDVYIAENGDGIYETNILQKVTGLNVSEPLKRFYPQIGSGTLLWILMIVFGYLMKTKRKKIVLFLIPAFACWLGIMLATPVAFSLRYVYILAFQLPFFLILPFVKMNSKEDSAETPLQAEKTDTALESHNKAEQKEQEVKENQYK